MLIGTVIPIAVASHECVLIGESTILGPWYRTWCPEFIPKSIIEEPIMEKIFIEKRVIEEVEDNLYTYCKGVNVIQFLGIAYNNTVCLKDPNSKEMQDFAKLRCQVNSFRSWNVTDNC